MGGYVPQIESRCPICDIPTKMHKTYHLATQHFKERLLATLPTRKPFKCPDCEQYESKTRINLWTHYLGKHGYNKKWAEEVLLQQRKNPAAVMTKATTTATPKDSKSTPTSSETTSPLVPLQASMQAAIHASMPTPIKSTATENGRITQRKPGIKQVPAPLLAYPAGNGRIKQRERRIIPVHASLV